MAQTSKEGDECGGDERVERLRSCWRRASSINGIINTNDIEETTNQTTSIIKSFDNTFESGNLIDTLSQVGEVGLDYTLELSNAAPILKDIPVLGLIVSGTKTVANIRSHVLANKVFKFFYEIKDVPIEKRREFSEEYCQANREDTAVALLSILDRLNNQNYVPIICRLMKAKIDGEITIAEFNRAVVALERIPYTDIPNLEDYVTDHYESGVTEILFAAGVLRLSHEDFENSTNEYQLNKTGFLLLKYGVGVDVIISTDNKIKRISMRPEGFVTVEL